MLGLYRHSDPASDDYEAAVLKPHEVLGVQTHVQGRQALQRDDYLEEPEDGIILVRQNISSDQGATRTGGFL